MADTETSSLVQLSASKIAAYALQDPRYPEIEHAQVCHRIRLIHKWGITPGARVLEIGCGQGNCTTVLAEAVGPTGHVDAVDPAPGDYGSPFALAQAQAHISAAEIGSCITWHRADPVEFLGSMDRHWDFAVLSHCIWYFQSPDTLRAILKSLRARAGKICIAEYALHASIPAAVSHVLAALTRATLEAHKKESTENIQTPLSPAGIKDIAQAEGLAIDHESTITPEAQLSDGRWEVGTVVDSGFLKEISQHVADDRVALLIRSMRDSVLSAVEQAGTVKSAQTMDVWIAVFRPENTG